MLEEGAIIAGLGMGTVFAFLIIMVCMISVTSKLIELFNKMFPESDSSDVKTVNSTDNNAMIALAIMAAKRQMSKGK